MKTEKLFREFLKTLSVRDSTLRSYLWSFRYFPEKLDETQKLNQAISGLSENSQSTVRKNFRAFVKYCQETGNYSGKIPKLKTGFKEIDSVYLTENELEKIRLVELPANLEAARKCFLLMALSGLRDSDLRKLTMQNISFQTGEITMIQHKTGTLVRIPMHPKLSEILKTGIPVVESQQSMNKKLKDLCLLAGLTGLVPCGGKMKPKYEMVSTHSARRSFISNLYLSGFPMPALMKISGHKTEIAFFRYVRLSRDEASQELARFWGKP